MNSLRTGLMALLLSSLAFAAAAQGLPSRNVPVTALQYQDTGVTDVTHGKIGQLKAAAAYGDLGKGAHGTFVRMPAGWVSRVHTHTGDFWAVVISGVVVNGVPGAQDVPLPVGSYWYQKGGEQHVTRCVSPNECLFFLSQQQPFDYEIDPAK